jgi:hypothetical protein
LYGVNHDDRFPISAGQIHSGLDCSTYHTDPTNRKVLGCIICHSTNDPHKPAHHLSEDSSGIRRTDFRAIQRRAYFVSPITMTACDTAVRRANDATTSIHLQASRSPREILRKIRVRVVPVATAAIRAALVEIGKEAKLIHDDS